MLIALLAAVGSVALGASIALIPRVRGDALGRVRTFALIAAVTAVVGHLLPEATEALGPLALALVVLGIVLPTWIEDGLERLAGTRGSIGLEIGYAGLLVHHVGDGVALYQYGASPHASLDVVLALVAHTLPVTAVVVVQYLDLGGPRAAFLRAGGLAAATVLGTVAGSLFPEVLDALSPWIAALVSGLLLHVIAHGLEADPPRTHAARALDLAAAAAGVLLPVLAAAHVDLTFTRSVGHVLERAAPMLLAGVIAAAALGARAPSPRRWLAAIASVPQRATLRTARELLDAGARPGVAAAIAFAAPAVRVETVLLAAAFLGISRALQWTVAAIAIAAAAALLIDRLGAGGGANEAHHHEIAPPFLERAGDVLAHSGPWLLAGALGTVYADSGSWSRCSRCGTRWSSSWPSSPRSPRRATSPRRGSSPSRVSCSRKGSPGARCSPRSCSGPSSSSVRSASSPPGAGRSRRSRPRSRSSSSRVRQACSPRRLEPAGAPSGGVSVLDGVPAWIAGVLLGLLVLRNVWMSGIRSFIAGLGLLPASADHHHHHQ